MTGEETMRAIRRTFNQVYDQLPHAVKSSKALQGKRERAMLNGDEYVWQNFRIGKLDIKVCFRLKCKAWLPILTAYEDDKPVLLSQYSDKGGGSYVNMIRAHAIERYVQRYVYHDESHVVTEDEFEQSLRRIYEQIFTTTAAYYDRASGYHLQNIDGGAFVCHVNPVLKATIFSTFITVSMMKDNQRLANGLSMKRTEKQREFMEQLSTRQLLEILYTPNAEN